MHRFFISKESFSGNDVSITGQTAYQITHVLRLKPGVRIVVLNDSGWEFETEIESINRDIVRGKVIKKQKGKGEAGLNLTLCQALLKTDKLEVVLQKAVELGVSNFVPFASARCIVSGPSENRIRRWQTIIREAAEQSRRSRLPVLQPAISFEETCKRIKTPSLILWESENKQELANILKYQPFLDAKAITVMVGPEGGFTPDEIKLARKHGIVSAGLGRRIFRAETAGLVAISAIMYEKGELG